LKKILVTAGADYIGIGPLFATPTKEDYPPLGLKTVKKVVDKISIPIVAMGGINLINISLVHETGIRSIAMLRQFQHHTLQVVSQVNSLLLRR